MKKRTIAGVVIGSLLLLGALSAIGANDSSKLNNVETVNTIETVAPICDGSVITSNCKLDDISYKTYIYHPAVAEKSHIETETTYHEEVSGYCTLCNDGTYSPSCATGRGACSHHGGVAQWNAPIHRSVPTTTTKTVVDSPAKDAYYEKVAL